MHRTPCLPSLLIILATLPAATATSAPADYNLAAIDTWLLPAYQKLERSTRELDASASDYCKVADRHHLAALQQAYTRGLGAWQRVQVLRFGPVTAHRRIQRFETWPDPDDSVGRQLDRLLNTADPASLTSGVFQDGSVAIQGFSALERLLFTDPALEKQGFEADDWRFYCAVIGTITANLAGMSAAIMREWTSGTQPFREVIASAGDGNDFFSSREHVSATVRANLHDELRRVVTHKLDQPLGASLEQARGDRAESWRSARSLDNIRQNLLGCQALFRTAIAQHLNDADQKRLIDARFSRGLDAVDAIPGRLASAVADPLTRASVETLRRRVAELTELFGGTP